MSTLQINELYVRNFLSYGEATLRLAHRGLVLLRAENRDDPSFSSNGSGKSALLPDALVYAFFGRTARGVTGPDVIRRQHGKDCLVRISGVDRGVPFVIERGQKCRARSKPMFLWGDEEVHGDKEVTARVAQMLGGIDYTTFATALVFGGERPFTQLGDADRKKILERLAGFEVLSLYEKAAKVACEGVEEQQDAVETKLTAAREVLDEIRRQATEQKTKADQFEGRRAKALSDLAAQHADIAGRLAHARQEQQEAEAAAAVQSVGGGPIKAALDEINQGLQEATQTHQEARQARDDLRVAQRGVAAQEGRFEALQAGGLCPTCEQKVSEKHLRGKQGGLRAERERLDAELAEAENVLREAGEHVNEVLASQQALLKSLRELDDQSKAEIGKARAAAVTVQGYERDLARIEREQASTKAQTNDAKASLESLRERGRAKRTEVAELEAEETRLSEELAYLAFCVTMFGNTGLKSQMMDTIVPQLNESADAYSEILTDQALRIVFDPTRQTKEGVLKEELTIPVVLDGEEVPYKSCSKGQRQRADILATLALGDLAARRVGQPINLVALDEVFDGLDEAGVARAHRLLQELGRSRDSVFVISHHEGFAANFPAVETVIMEDKTSRLVPLQ